MLEVALLRRQFKFPEAAIRDVALQLLRVRGPLALRRAVLAAPPGQRPDPRRALVQRNIILVTAGEARRALGGDKGRQPKLRAEFDQHILERPHVAVGRQHRLADRIPGTIGAADRPIEQ